MDKNPSVVFVCVGNGGKSQMAAALARKAAGDRLDILSAGTRPGTNLNALSQKTVEEVGANFDGEFPKQLTDEMIRESDRIIIIGNEAQVEPLESMRGSIERWDTDEPSTRGIEGEERMRLIRDDIQQRVDGLVKELLD